jgi:hypothetical protein
MTNNVIGPARHAGGIDSWAPSTFTNSGSEHNFSSKHNCVCSVSQTLGRFFSQFSRNGLSLFVAIAILTLSVLQLWETK